MRSIDEPPAYTHLTLPAALYGLFEKSLKDITTTSETQYTVISLHARAVLMNEAIANHASIVKDKSIDPHALSLELKALAARLDRVAGYYKQAAANADAAAQQLPLK